MQYPQPDDWLKEFMKRYAYVPETELYFCRTCRNQLEYIDDNIVQTCQRPECLAMKALQQ